MMNNTSSKSNLDDPSEDFKGYAYYSVGLSLGFLLLMTFIALTAYYLQTRQTRPNSSNSSSNSSHRTVTIERDSSAITIQLCEEQQEAILNSYPVLLFSQAKLHKPDSTALSCSICLADYKDSEWLRLLPDCGHFFHRDCIDMWLRLNLSCPMCRNSPFTTPLSTPLAEVAPLDSWFLHCPSS